MIVFGPPSAVDAGEQHSVHDGVQNKERKEKQRKRGWRSCGCCEDETQLIIVQLAEVVD